MKRQLIILELLSIALIISCESKEFSPVGNWIAELDISKVDTTEFYYQDYVKAKNETKIEYKVQKNGNGKFRMMQQGKINENDFKWGILNDTIYFDMDDYTIKSVIISNNKLEVIDNSSAMKVNLIRE